MTRVFVPRESAAGETRVAATPETVKKMATAGLEVSVQEGAGNGANIPDEAFREAGADIEEDGRSGWSGADLVIKVAPPGRDTGVGDEASMLRAGAVLVGFLAPYTNLDLVRTLAGRNVSALAMELIPRVTRAQPMDALSSQASIAGYKSVLMAAERLGKYFPQMMTAAGTVKPARVVVLGAGVAGLQAIATARRLGAVVEVSDIRPEVAEQVKSLGGKFIELPVKESGSIEGGYAREVSEEFLRKQQEIVAARVAAADVVVTTALVPGKPAPRLLTAAMVRRMRPGSVIVDLAVEQGGNCELSVKGREVVENGVRIIGHPNLPATVAGDASNLYARNVWALVRTMLNEERGIELDPRDEVIAGCLLTHGGEVAHEGVARALRKGGKS
jgi:NAD(P) transhydrogenase subunit alpha